MVNPAVTAWCPTCNLYVCPLTRSEQPANTGPCQWCESPTHPTKEDMPVTAKTDAAYDRVARESTSLASLCAQLVLPFEQIDGVA